MERSKRNFLKTMTYSAATLGLAGLSSLGKLANASTISKSSKPAKTKKARRPGSDTDWSAVRNQFPLTHSRVYFNNGTMGPSPEPVLTAVIQAMKQVDITGEHREADGADLRAKIASLIGATPEEISLTHNTTEGIDIVAQGLPLKSGDEVIITTHEHVGNALPWLNRARIDGIVLKSFEPPRTASEVLAKIESLITSKTRVIAVPHISCTTGQVFPIEEITKLAHQKKLWCFVDGAHGVGMVPLAMHDWGIDFYASCGHKWILGPKGTGFLYVNKELLDTVQARFVGAYSDTGWSLAPPRLDGLAPTAHRFDYGTQNTALYVGLSAAIDFFTQIGMQKISEYGFGLAQTLHDELLGISGVELLTPTEPRSRAMMTTFRFKGPGKDYVQFAAHAGKNGFRVRQVPEAGLNAIRVSTHLYNSKTEVMKFAELVRQYLS